MFKIKPISLTPKPTSADLPEGQAVMAARERVDQLKAAIADAESQRESLGAHILSAEQRLAKAAAERDGAEQLTRRAAVGENVPRPSPYQLAGLIESHAVAESDAAKVRRRVTAETERLDGELLKLREKLTDAEHSVDTARFHELVEMYREAIRPAIPLAVALRNAAEKLSRRCDSEPLLIDPDADYGRQLFGATI